MSRDQQMGGWRSSPLMVMFKQQAFDAYAANHRWAAHVGAIFFALVVLACLAAVVIAFPQYLSNRHLLREGVEALGAIDHVAVRSYKSGKSNTEKYEIDMRYHFATPNGRRYEGTSKVDTLDPKLVTNGMRIAVLYDAENPASSGWRNALGQASRDYFVFLGITLLVSAWLGLFIYRYMRWRRRGAEPLSST